MISGKTENVITFLGKMESRLPMYSTGTEEMAEGKGKFESRTAGAIGQRKLPAGSMGTRPNYRTADRKGWIGADSRCSNSDQHVRTPRTEDMYSAGRSREVRE